MTTAQGNIRFGGNSNAALPSVRVFLRAIMETLKDHDGGKALGEVIECETLEKIYKNTQLTRLAPALQAAEIQYRLARAIELLERGGFIYRQGTHHLKLSSRALIASHSDIDALTQSPAKISAPQALPAPYLPLPDEVATAIVGIVRSNALNALEIEEHILRKYSEDGAVPLHQTSLDLLRQRAITARRVLESKKLIEKVDGQYQLTSRGLGASPLQLRQITCMSVNALLLRYMICLRLRYEQKAHLDARQIIAHELLSFLGGVFRYLFKGSDKNRGGKLSGR